MLRLVQNTTQRESLISASIIGSLLLEEASLTELMPVLRGERGSLAQRAILRAFFDPLPFTPGEIKSEYPSLKDNINHLLPIPHLLFRRQIQFDLEALVTEFVVVVADKIPFHQFTAWASMKEPFTGQNFIDNQLECQPDAALRLRRLLDVGSNGR